MLLNQLKNKIKKCPIKKRKKKIWIKKNLSKKKIGQKNYPEKGKYPKRGTNWPQKGIFCFAGGYTLKSYAQSKFEAKRLKIAPFMTDRTFWDPKLPHSHYPIMGHNLEFKILLQCR